MKKLQCCQVRQQIGFQKSLSNCRNEFGCTDSSRKLLATSLKCKQHPIRKTIEFKQSNLILKLQVVELSLPFDAAYSALTADEAVI
jgi:hypothetical protein